MDLLYVFYTFMKHLSFMHEKIAQLTDNLSMMSLTKQTWEIQTQESLLLMFPPVDYRCGVQGFHQAN